MIEVFRKDDWFNEEKADNDDDDWDEKKNSHFFMESPM